MLPCHMEMLPCHMEMMGLKKMLAPMTLILMILSQGAQLSWAKTGLGWYESGCVQSNGYNVFVDPHMVLSCMGATYKHYIYNKYKFASLFP